MTDEDVTQSLVDVIALEIRKGLEQYKDTPLTIDRVREQIKEVWGNWYKVEQDPNDPSVVIVTYQPPKQIVLTVDLGMWDEPKS